MLEITFTYISVSDPDMNMLLTKTFPCKRDRNLNNYFRRKLTKKHVCILQKSIQTSYVSTILIYLLDNITQRIFFFRTSNRQRDQNSIFTAELSKQTLFLQQVLHHMLHLRHISKRNDRNHNRSKKKKKDTYLFLRRVSLYECGYTIPIHIYNKKNNQHTSNYMYVAL